MKDVLSQYGRRVLRALLKQTPPEYAPTCYDPSGRLLVTDEDRLAFEAQMLELTEVPRG